MIYPVVVYGHPVLRKVAEEIGPDYPQLQTLIEDMFATMYKAEGIGLAAPQIGKAIRLFVIDADDLKDDHPELAGFKRIFINPTIVEYNSDEAVYAEGCLSLPSIREEVKRPTRVKIKYFNAEFQLCEEVLEDFSARVFQHEYDHIEGKLLIDYLSPLRKRLLKGKLTSISKGTVPTDYRIVTP